MVQIPNHFLQLIDWYPLFGTIILVEVALSHYSQNPESPSNVYFFASLPLELLQYNYDLGDCDCSKITLLSLLPDIHTCRPGSNGSKVAIRSITYIKNFLTVLAFLIVSHRQHYILIWRVATDFLIWAKLCKVLNSSQILKMKINYEVV